MQNVVGAPDSHKTASCSQYKIPIFYLIFVLFSFSLYFPHSFFLLLFFFIFSFLFFLLAISVRSVLTWFSRHLQYQPLLDLSHSIESHCSYSYVVLKLRSVVQCFTIDTKLKESLPYAGISSLSFFCHAINKIGNKMQEKKTEQKKKMMKRGKTKKKQHQATSHKLRENVRERERERSPQSIF